MKRENDNIDFSLHAGHLVVPLIAMHAILESESYTIDAPACTRLV